MKESKARLDNSRILPEFYWWEAADIKRIFAKVEAIGLENRTATTRTTSATFARPIVTGPDP
jgi:hypothetical protein